MTKQAKLKKESLDVAEKAVQAGLDMNELKEKVAHAIEDGVTDAKRMIKKGRYAAEDLVDETEHHIKQDPWRSVGVTFGVGFGLGAIVGLLLAKKATKN